MAEAKVCITGMPTRIETNLLLEKWPVKEMQPGHTFSYELIAEIISADQSSHRFRTVTDAWRRYVEKETGIRIMPDGTATQFKVLSEPEKLEAIKDKRRSLNRQGRKNLVRTGYIDRKQLDETQRETYDFMAANERKILAVSQLRQKQIE